MNKSCIKIILYSRERITVYKDQTLILSSKLFTWNKIDQMFTANASIFDNYVTRLAYHDYAWGFVMRSERTNRCVWFEYLVKAPNRTPNSMKFVCPELDNLPLVVYND